MVEGVLSVVIMAKLERKDYKKEADGLRRSNLDSGAVQLCRAAESGPQRLGSRPRAQLTDEWPRGLHSFSFWPLRVRLIFDFAC